MYDLAALFYSPQSFADKANIVCVLLEIPGRLIVFHISYGSDKKDKFQVPCVAPVNASAATWKMPSH